MSKVQYNVWTCINLDLVVLGPLSTGSTVSRAAVVKNMIMADLIWRKQSLPLDMHLEHVACHVFLALVCGGTLNSGFCNASGDFVFSSRLWSDTTLPFHLKYSRTVMSRTSPSSSLQQGRDEPKAVCTL